MSTVDKGARFVKNLHLSSLNKKCQQTNTRCSLISLVCNTRSHDGTGDKSPLRRCSRRPACVSQPGARPYLPLHVLGERLPAGVELMTVRALVLLLVKVGFAAVLLPVNSQVILGRIALVTNITLKGLLTCVHAGVALVFP